MIERYSRKEIKNIWEDKNKYSIWLEIELAAAEAMEKLKIIPKGVSKKVKSKAKINVKRILQIEEKVKHDVIAFLTSITEKVGKEARYLHKGMTSSDVLDTCFNLQLKQSGEILIKMGTCLVKDTFMVLTFCKIFSSVSGFCKSLRFFVFGEDTFIVT